MQGEKQQVLSFVNYVFCKHTNQWEFVKFCLICKVPKKEGLFHGFPFERVFYVNVCILMCDFYFKLIILMIILFRTQPLVF